MTNPKSNRKTVRENRPSDMKATSPVGTVRLWQIFLIFLRLGLTSFGGPVAHIGYFREEFVARRK